ncbi:MAG: zinc-binding dehydrogenase, partial [Bacteroidetes bacterium]|nr:zinc-binding dehydrogenase [Bacteroidota bacterium]
FTDPGSPTGFAFRKTAIPDTAPDQALIRVKAFSLNQGETRTALATASSYTPGWDFAGVVVKGAADGSTPKKGARVFGYVASGSWATYLAAPGGLMAEIPEGVTDAQAACLPIAGVTALACLDASGDIQDRRVLITGASGGVGRFACQLAAMAGAKVFAVSRRAELMSLLKQDGVEPSGIFGSMAAAKAAGNYDVIWESIGGETLATGLTALARGGICINFGNSSRQPTTFTVRAEEWPLHSLRCLWLGREPVYPSTPLLDRLARSVQEKNLFTPVDSELPWTDIADATDRLLKLLVNGKIVLHVEG